MQRLDSQRFTCSCSVSFENCEVFLNKNIFVICVDPIFYYEPSSWTLRSSAGRKLTLNPLYVQLPNFISQFWSSKGNQVISIGHEDLNIPGRKLEFRWLRQNVDGDLHKNTYLRKYEASTFICVEISQVRLQKLFQWRLKVWVVKIFGLFRKYMVRKDLNVPL